jgi:putative FmdB family regulatory protein
MVTTSVVIGAAGYRPILRRPMPIYEYRCENGHHVEVMQKITDDPLTHCETCGSALQRVFHPVAVHFKGSGFYNTDYGTKKRARETKEAGDKGGSSSSSSDSGSSTSSSSDSSSSSSKSESTSSSSSSSAKKD